MDLGGNVDLNAGKIGSQCGLQVEETQSIRKHLKAHSACSTENGLHG